LVPGPVPNRALSATGALLCALAVALGAFASHGAEPDQQSRLALAALVLFGHGLALNVLAPAGSGRRVAWALWLLLVGCLLFSGSLIGADLLGTGAPLAPIGGATLISGWLLLAVARLRP